MAIGRLSSLPPGNSNWARFRDEYNNHWSVKADQIPEDVKPGEELAYRLDFSQQRAPQVQILEEED